MATGGRKRERTERTTVARRQTTAAEAREKRSAQASATTARTTRRPASDPAAPRARFARAAQRFPIVAIGASAGGIETFKRFFSHMPPDSGMGFVLMPFPDPTHKSLMADVLSKETSMPVHEAVQGTLIRPNHVYVIPPNRYPAIRRRRLVLSELPWDHLGHTAIDYALGTNTDLEGSNGDRKASSKKVPSMNEEFTTVDSQFEKKVNDLGATNSDLTNLVSATDIAIVFLDPELRIRRFTAPAGQLLHFLPADIGRPLLHFAPNFTDEGFEKDAQTVIRTSIAMDKEIFSSDQRWYLRRILPYRGANGPLGVVVTFIDVTERMEAEAQARRMATVLRDSSDAITVTDLEGHISAWNRGAAMLYGYPESKALHMSIGDLATDTTRQQALDVVRRSAGGEEVPPFETQRRASDGRTLEVWATVTLLRDATGKPVSLAITERDVTARHQAEQQIRALNVQLEARVEERTRALQASEQQIRAILDASAEAIVTIDQTGTIIAFNRTATQLFGYSMKEAIGQNVRMLLPPSERDQHNYYLRRYLQTHEPHILGKSRAFSACRKDGVMFPIRLTVTEVKDRGLFVGCIRDETASRALQAEVLHIATLEQRRIGQELHDGTQQELVGLGLLAQNLKEALAYAPNKTQGELAARLASGIAETNRHVRALSRGLLPVPVDAATLPAALQELARGTEEIYKIKCRLSCPQSLPLRDTGTATHLYRIVQEAVSNAARHSRADTISIRVAPAQSEIVLEVQDNGVGIDVAKRPHEGAGLRLMEHRCSVIGGRFSVTALNGRGTVIACSIPATAQSADDRSTRRG